MEKYILIGAGSPSDLDELNKNHSSLGNLTVFEYLKARGIRQLDRPLNVSCHRTLDRAIGYAKDLQMVVDDGNALVAVFCGGLSLALPGIVSSQTTTVPIIGVPFYSKGTHGAGIDSATAVWNLPPGTVVGGAPVHFPEDSPGIDRAVLLAEKVLDSAGSIVHVIGPAKSKQFMAIRRLINPPEGRPYDSVQGVFGIHYEHRKEVYKDDRLEVSLSVCGANSELSTIDSRSNLALQSRMARNTDDIDSFISRMRIEMSDFMDTVITLNQTRNTLYFARPENAALFLARMQSLKSDDIRGKLQEYNEAKAKETGKRYGDWRRITNSSFA